MISFPRKEENRNRNDFTALKETYRNLHYQHHAPPFDGMWVAKFWASSAHVESTVRYIHTYTAAAAAVVGRSALVSTHSHPWVVCPEEELFYCAADPHTHRLPILKRKNIAVLTSDDDAYKNGCCIISLIAKINIFFKKIKYLLLPWMQADSLVIQTSRGHSLWNNFKKTFLNVPARQIKQCILPLQIALFFPDFEAQCVHARLLGLCPSYSIQEIWRPAATYCWKSKS